MSMVARTPEPKDPARLVPFTFRIPVGMVDALDLWLEEQNNVRKGAPLTRSDLIRGLLGWAAETKPEWEPGKFVLELQDGKGRTLATKRTNETGGGEATFTVNGKTVVGRFGGVTTGDDGEPKVIYLRA